MAQSIWSRMVDYLTSDPPPDRPLELSRKESGVLFFAVGAAFTAEPLFFSGTFVWWIAATTTLFALIGIYLLVTEDSHD